MRGRIVRLGAAIDDILTARLPARSPTCWARPARSPPWSAPAEVRRQVIVQAQGGPVSLVVADFDTSGGMRGYCRYDAARVRKPPRASSGPRPHPAGDGAS